MKRIAGELRDLSPVLLTVNSRQQAKVSPPTATLDMMIKELDGQIYVFAVNRESKEFEATISVKGAKPASDIEVLFEQRTLQSLRGVWTDHFRPLEAHVYRFRLR